MKELSIKAINEKAAYTVYTTTSKQDFSFLKNKEEHLSHITISDAHTSLYTTAASH